VSRRFKLSVAMGGLFLISILLDELTPAHCIDNADELSQLLPLRGVRHLSRLIHLLLTHLLPPSPAPNTHRANETRKSGSQPPLSPGTPGVRGPNPRKTQSSPRKPQGSARDAVPPSPQPSPPRSTGGEGER